MRSQLCGMLFGIKPTALTPIVSLEYYAISNISISEWLPQAPHAPKELPCQDAEKEACYVWYLSVVHGTLVLIFVFLAQYSHAQSFFHHVCSNKTC